MSKVNELLSDLESAWVISLAKDEGEEDAIKIKGGDVKYIHDIINTAINMYYACVNIQKHSIPTRYAYEVDAISIFKIKEACKDFYNAIEPDANKDEP